MFLRSDNVSYDRFSGRLCLRSQWLHGDERPSRPALVTVRSGDHFVSFTCDFLRMISPGTKNSYEAEALMGEELETHHHELSQAAAAVH